MEDPPVRHGYLLTPPQGKLLKRTWQRKYYALYRASNYAVERVEVFDSEEGYLQLATSKRIIPLNDCVKVVQVPQKNQQNVFEVRTKKQVYQFSTETTQELAEWVSAFQMVAFQMVAFGGRRELISPISLGPSGASTPTYSSPSQSLQIKAEEEENQIYSSCSWPEVHYIQIVETEASTACGLRGTYRLVVSPLQLLLFEDGANVSSREPLFVWPYRHIRRYGRSKEAFTFEAGRKCSSGEGTFTFATSEANLIFLQVQRSTRTLKREGEDVASFTPNLLFSKAPVWPTPQLETLDFRAKAESMSAADESSLQRKLSQDSLNRPKVIAPFAKPVRKPKLSIGDDKTSLTEPIRLEISNAARAKLAAEAMMNSSTRHVMPIHLPSEPTYAEPEIRKDAWKTFALETDNIHQEKIPDVPDQYSKPYYASVPLSPTVPSSQLNRIISPPKKTPDNNDDYCYDHLVQFGSVQTTKAVESSPEGHIYSRLVSVNSQSEQLPTPPPIPTQPNYEEISEATDTISGNDVSEREDIKRFLQNDDLYTIVPKRSVKQSHPNVLTDAN